MENLQSISTIEEIAEKVAMGPFGSSIKVETFVSEGIPIISGQHLNGAKVDDSPGFNFISVEHARRLANANVTRGDIVFTHAGNIGQVAYIPEDSSFDRYVISQRQFYMRCDRKRVIPEYLVWYFKSPEGQHQLLANTSQVGVPSIAQPVTYLRTLAISLPPLSEQRAIAHILGTLDDKIELNRRMNETLEEIARALFKSWFVDFDPVRAKAALRTPPADGSQWTVERSRAYLEGMDNSVANLFPDRLVDSELGEVPEGWDIKALGEIVDVVNGRSYRSADLRDSDVALVTLKSVKRGGGYSPDGLKPYTGTFDPSQVVRAGDLIVAQTDVTQAAEVIGRPALIYGSSDYKTLVASLDLLVLRPKPPVTVPLLYGLLQGFDFHNHALARVNGTTVLHLQKDAIPAFRFALPTQSIVAEFTRTVSQLISTQQIKVAESRNLTALRDALLPKLMSGEIRIGNSQRRTDR